MEPDLDPVHPQEPDDAGLESKAGDADTPTADLDATSDRPDRLVLHPSDTVTQLHYEATMPARSQRVPRVIWLAVALGALLVAALGMSLFANAPPGRTPGPSTTGSLDVNVDGARETGQVLVTGTDFQPGESVDILLDGVLIDSAVVGSDGSFSKAVQIGSVTSGEMSAEGLTSLNSASKEFEVRTFPGSASPST